MSHAQLTHSGHISALGRRLGTTKATWWAFGPLMVATFLALGVAMFAPADLRPLLAGPLAAGGLLAFVVFPLWYCRGWLRLAGTAALLLLLAVGVVATRGFLHLIVVVFG